MYILIAGIIGLFVGFGICFIFRKTRDYSGVIKVIREENKLIYSLELHEDPEKLEYMSEVVFKVATSD